MDRGWKDHTQANMHTCLDLVAKSLMMRLMMACRVQFYLPRFSECKTDKKGMLGIVQIIP